MECEQVDQPLADCAPSTPHARPSEGYWEDVLMQFAIGAELDENPNESLPELARPLALSDF